MSENMVQPEASKEALEALEATPSCILTDVAPIGPARLADIQRLAKMTNVEFVTELMNWSKFGPIAQSYIIEAIRFYSERITSMPEPKDDPSSFISPVLWHQIATDIQDQIKKKYERK